MKTRHTLHEDIPRIEALLGYEFANKELLALAFVHRSYYNEHRQEMSSCNERLEFLGDSVLGLIAGEFLFHLLPEESEGMLSSLRAQIVDAPACAGYVQKLSLQDWILLGRGEKMNEHRGKETIQADFFEALMAAVFLDGGFLKAKEFFEKHFFRDLLQVISEPSRNWKAELQDFVQRKIQKPPIYQVVEETGPDHHKKFIVAVFMDEQEIGRGSGSSKKQAEAQAAKDAMVKFSGLQHG